MDCSKRRKQPNKRSSLKSLKDFRAFIASLQFVANQLGVINRSRYGQQFQNIGLLYSQIISVFYQNRELLLVGGGMTLRLLAKFFLHKHPYPDFFHGMMGRMMMSMLSRKNKFPDLKCVATLEGHGGNVFSVAFDPTGRFVATGSWDDTAKVWSMSPDGTAATCVATLAGHSGCVFSVAFDPTGSFVATGSGDNTAKVWSMSPDGTAATCVATLAGHSSFVYSVAFDPTGRFVATGSHDNTAKVWRMSPDGAAATCVATLAGHRSTVSSVAFDPTGRFVATGSHDNTAKVWNLSDDNKSATCSLTWKNMSSVLSVAFCPRHSVLGINFKSSFNLLS